MDSEEFGFRYNCGVAKPTWTLELKDRDLIIGSIAKHYAIMYCMSELIQLKEGMASLKVLELLQANVHITRQLLVHSGQSKIGADKLYDIMKAD